MTTYGWAILVIIILLSALMFLGILNPKASQSRSLTFAPGQSAYSFKVLSGTGEMKLDFGQANGKTIRVTALGCSRNGTVAAQEMTLLSQNVSIGSGEHQWISGMDSGNTVYCTDVNGDNLTSADSQVNEQYKGTVCIAYTETGIAEISRLTCGDLTTRFEAEGQPGGTATPGSVPSATPSSTPSGSPTTTPEPTPTPTPTPFCGGVCAGGVCDGCGGNISSGGMWTFSNDSVCAGCNGVDILPGAEGAILDCGGKSLFGQNAGVGIYVSTSPVTIRNCKLFNFEYGLIASGSNSLLENNFATNSTYGFYLASSQSTEFVGNTANASYSGFYSVGQNYYNIYRNNNFSNNNYYGFQNEYCTNCTYDGNIMINNGGFDLASYGTTGHIDMDNNICNSRYYETTIQCRAQNSCPQSITSCCNMDRPLTYTLANSLTSSGTCLTAEAGRATMSGMVIDCAGKSITGDDTGYGIISNVDSATIKDCIISDFEWGMGLGPAPNGIIQDNTITGCTSGGFQASGTVGSQFTRNKVTESVTGYSSWGSNHNVIFKDNNFSNNSFAGLYEQQSNNQTYDGNIFLGNGYYDVSCYACGMGTDMDNNLCNIRDYVKVIECRATDSCPNPITACCSIDRPVTYTLAGNIAATGDCIKIHAGRSNVEGAVLDCENKQITGPGSNVGRGVYVGNGAQGVTVKDCQVSGFGYGLSAEDAGTKNNNFIGNNASGNYAGLLMWTSSPDYSNVTGNWLQGNSAYGFYMYYIEGVNVRNNTITGSGAYDLYCYGCTPVDGLDNICVTKDYCDGIACVPP